MSNEARERPKPVGIGAFLFNELRQAIQDIRQKVVEQGWFGRVTTPKPVVEMPFESMGDKGTNGPDLSQGHRPSFEELWSPKDRAERAPEHGIDIDR